jgi:hypothetical protein
VSEYSHALGVASIVVHVAIKTRIPIVQFLIEAIKPIGSSREIDDLLPRNSMRDKARNWVTNKHVCQLDMAPQKVPDIGLG